MSGAERARRYRHRVAELGKPQKASERWSGWPGLRRARSNHL